jgi:FAD/FMN-containing dehydrogenase
VYVGDVDEGMAALAPFRELATPVADISQPMPFHTVQSAFDWLTPPGVHRAYWKSQYLPALSDEVIAVLAAHAQTRPGDTMLVNVFHMGGAIAEVAPDATAFSERAWPYMVSIDGMWPDSDDDADRIAWVRRVWDDVATFGTGTTYTNFTGQFDETLSDSADSALGENLARLRALKGRYDPTNFFRLNANIEPA